LDFLKELLGSGSATPIVDRTFTLEGLRDGLYQLAGGQTRGKVVTA
jgi:NADPH:quinone reductase-like Zn-dependent oxidoreductase